MSIILLVSMLKKPALFAALFGGLTENVSVCFSRQLQNPLHLFKGIPFCFRPRDIVLLKAIFHVEWFVSLILVC